MAVTGAHPLLEEIEGAIIASQPGARREPLLAFNNALLKRTARDRLQSLSTEELARQVMDLFEMVDERRDPIAVRVIPSPPAGTALEVNLPDAPFLVDTVRETISAQGYGVRLLLHPVIGVERDADGHILRIANARGAPLRESVMRVEIDRELDTEQSAALQAAVERALGDLQKAVADFPRMLETISRMIDAARGATARYGEDEIDETVAFLEWLRANHFVLLGSRDYSIYDVDGTPCFMAVRGSGLGVLQDEGTTGYAEPMPVADLPAIVLTRLIEGELLGIIKTAVPLDRAPARAHGRHRDQEDRLRGRGRGPDPHRGPLHLARVHGAGRTHAAPAPEAAQARAERGSDRGLARLQGGRRHLRVVPARRAVPGSAPRTCATR